MSMLVKTQDRKAGLWFRMFRGERTRFKETMLGVMLLQEMRELIAELTMFMANLSSIELVYDEAGPSYDSNTLSEVQNQDNCLDDDV
nr:hypothetical protein [Tanacetum cinerariifolium]